MEDLLAALSYEDGERRDRMKSLFQSRRQEMAAFTDFLRDRFFGEGIEML